LTLTRHAENSTASEFPQNRSAKAHPKGLGSPAASIPVRLPRRP
jgi:hypothetical protein